MIFWHKGNCPQSTQRVSESLQLCQIFHVLFHFLLPLTKIGTSLLLAFFIIILKVPATNITCNPYFYSICTCLILSSLILRKILRVSWILVFFYIPFLCPTFPFPSLFITLLLFWSFPFPSHVYDCLRVLFFTIFAPFFQFSYWHFLRSSVYFYHLNIATFYE